GEERTTGLEQGAGQRVAAEPGIRSRIRPERSTAGLQVRVLRAVDGAPAAGVVVVARPLEGANPLLRARLATTGRDGLAEFGDLASSGTWQVELDRAAVHTVVGTPPSESTATTLRLPAAIAVRGRVVDGDGQALGGASIWLSSAARFDVGLVVATSADDGSFALADVAAGRALSAFAPGRLAAELAAVSAEGMPLELTLAVPGRSVRGRV